MNKIQFIELLKLRGVTELKGETLAMAVERTGGQPTQEEMVLVNLNAMKYYIDKFAEMQAMLAESKEEVSEVRRLLESQENDVNFLQCLRNMGVDNWQGYELAENEYYELYEEYYEG